MSEHRVVVIGAGIGGLVCALQLAARGCDVTVVEAAPQVGGKMRSVTVDGHPIDAGPTVFTMRWVFEELMHDIGSDLSELPELQPLHLLARHAWSQGGLLDLYDQPERSAQAIAEFSSAQESRRYLNFCDEAKRVYQTLEAPHIRSSRPGMGRMIADLGWRGLTTLGRLGPFYSLAHTLSQRFEDPRLRQLFARYATYCGASPWKAPATLMLVAHVEQDGVWSVRGGMSAWADGLAAAIKRRGGQIRLGCSVQSLAVRQHRVRGVVLSSGEHLSADSVVFNGDISALGSLWPTQDGALPQAPTPTAAHQRSLSAMTWAMHAQTRGLPLARHNVFFDTHYHREFEDIFERRRLPARATVYLCAQDQRDEPRHQEEPQRLLALVNAPADGDRRELTDTEIAACEKHCVALLRRCGLEVTVQNPQQVLRRTPADFARLFPGSGGALYGPATHGWTALFQRQSATTALPGLYLAGGSIHPGPGVPMAAMSGRLAAATLMAHLGSMRQLHPVRISGGTSTPSVTTAGMR